MAREQARQHVAADAGEALAPLAAQRLGHGHGVGGTAVVIVVGSQKDGCNRLHLLL